MWPQRCSSKYMVESHKETIVGIASKWQHQKDIAGNSNLRTFIIHHFSSIRPEIYQKSRKSKMHTLWPGSVIRLPLITSLLRATLQRIRLLADIWIKKESIVWIITLMGLEEVTMKWWPGELLLIPELSINWRLKSDHKLSIFPLAKFLISMMQRTSIKKKGINS